MYYLLDKDMNFIAPLETYQSAIWTSRYYKNGDFELYVPATIELIDLIQKDCLIVRDTDYTQAMIVENIEVQTDIENGNFLIVTGRCLKSILNRRIVWTQTIVSGTVESCIRQLINENIINPTISERKIDNFILGAEMGDTVEMKAQYTGDNLGTVITNLCITHGLGFDVLLDLDEKQYIFMLYKGLDRTYNQKENIPIVFSNEFGNLLNTQYVFNSEKFKNVALVAGEGEGVDRKKCTVGTASGMDRYELFVDSRNTSSNTDEEITEEEYTELLKTQGVEKLSESGTTESFDADLETNGIYQYGKNYFLGDYVEVENEYGKTLQPQITEVIESEDDTGTTVIVTFATETEEVK